MGWGVGEQEREETSPGATRSQHVVLQGPADLRMMSAAMRPGLERSRGVQRVAAPTCLVITPTVEQALSAAEQARLLLADESLRVVPVSSAIRARRVLAAGPVAVVTGTAADLLALRSEAAIDLQHLQVLVVFSLDEILAEKSGETLQALLGDAPDDMMRVATIDSETDEIDAFLEAQLRRARRLTPLLTGETPLAMTPSFVITSAGGRADALRGILDEVDPPSVVVVAATEAGLRDAQAAITRMGMVVDGLNVQVVRQATSQHVALVVLWEAPASHDALVEALTARPVDAVALLLPDELAAFRRMTAGLAEAWTPTVRKANAESRVQTLRTALRSTLANSGGTSASEMALLAPLLDTHDALEIAAAALRLYEGARRDALTVRAKAATAGPTRTPLSAGGRPDAPAATGKQRVFLAAGKRDGVRIGDIVGAVANEAGIPGERIGQVELFESHAIVELAADDAAKAVQALGSVSLRGRRLSARIDERTGDAPRGGDRGGDRGGARGPRSERTFGPPRGGPRRDAGDRPARPSFGGDRPARPSFGGDRGPRPEGRGGPPRGGPPRAADERLAFGDRPVRERAEGRAEWSERGERMQNASRKPRPNTEPGTEG
jgi:ATP-dependent RNA helicase DeaD